MKAAILVLACLGLAAAFTEDEYSMVFANWMVKYQISYPNNDLANRFALFKQNMDFVAKHNAKHAAGLVSYNLALNRFSDMTAAEKAQFRGLKGSKPSSPYALPFKPAEVGALPTAIDWRTKNMVTEVKDQGYCSSCWAFSSTCAMEGAHVQKTGQLVSLSEQQLVDCVKNGSESCDTGGNMRDGYDYAIENGGTERESDYPYEATSPHLCRFNNTKIAARFKTYYNVTSFDEGALQAAAASVPSVSVGINASPDEFYNYAGGIFDLPGCPGGWDDIDHGVAVVGYGVDSASGKEYWIVKNSWTTDWGEKGYIRMSRNKGNQCGIATDGSFPVAL